jgi:hypothetical protein
MAENGEDNIIKCCILKDKPMTNMLTTKTPKHLHCVPEQRASTQNKDGYPRVDPSAGSRSATHLRANVWGVQDQETGEGYENEEF